MAIAMLGLTSIAFAQKSEVKALDKAVKSEKYDVAKGLIAPAEALIGDADAKLKSKFYYLKAKTLLKGNSSNGVVDAVKSFEANTSDKYANEIAQLKNQFAIKMVNASIEDSNSSKFMAGGDKLRVAYDLTGDLRYLYYTAGNYVNGKDYKKALATYEELRKGGYTGVETTYWATNKATGKEENLGDKNTRDIYVKSGKYSNPEDKTSKSVKGEIVKQIGLLYMELGDNQGAIEAIKAARAENPKDVSMIITEANLYYKLGKNEDFERLMKEAIAQDPNNPVLFYNLGVIAAESKQTDKAREYYKKSLALRPDDVNTNINMASLILQEGQVIVDKMNKLTMSAADTKKFNAYEKEKNTLYKEAAVYLEKVLTVDGKNVAAAETLKGIYSSLGDMANFKKMKALLETIK